MSYRNGNYTAFYVKEPFSESNLNANATKDFCYYNLLRMWKGADSSFPFIDSHDKTYNVRDTSDWEKTLKPRLHCRLRNSKNVILFLSNVTLNSRALNEEIHYAISELALPFIVIYPDFQSVLSNGNIIPQIKQLWDKLPYFRDNINNISSVHIPLKKDLVYACLADPCFQVQTQQKGIYAL